MSLSLEWSLARIFAPITKIRRIVQILTHGSARPSAGSEPDFTNWRVLARRSLWNRSGASPKVGTTGSERSGGRAEGRGRDFWRGLGGEVELQALQQA